MPLTETLTWPFFEDGHRRFATDLSHWAETSLSSCLMTMSMPRAARG